MYVCWADMGLEIYCGDISMKVGSYSEVHRQRVGWLKAEAMRLDEQGEYDQAQLVYECFRNHEIFYGKLKQIRKIVLPGSWAFVHHSDCEGTWESHEAQQILEAIETMRNYLQRTRECSVRFHDNQYYLERVLRCSAYTGQTIEFS